MLDERLCRGLLLVHFGKDFCVYRRVVPGRINDASAILPPEFVDSMIRSRSRGQRDALYCCMGFSCKPRRPWLSDSGWRERTSLRWSRWWRSGANGSDHCGFVTAHPIAWNSRVMACFSPEIGNSSTSKNVRAHLISTVDCGITLLRSWYLRLMTLLPDIRGFPGGCGSQDRPFGRLGQR